MNISINAANTSRVTAINNNPDASIKTLLNLCFSIACRIIEIEIIPPANPATKYANISKTP